MKIVGICGSLRTDSFNRKALEYAKSIMPEGVTFKEIRIEAPLYNDDLDISEELIAVQKEIKEAGFVLIVSPEYNFSIPGVLKNFLDWMSIDPYLPFDGKKVAIMSASMGMLGGGRMQYHLRQVLLSLNAEVMHKPEVFIGSAHEKMDESGITDEKTKASILKLVKAITK